MSTAMSTPSVSKSTTPSANSTTTTPPTPVPARETGFVKFFDDPKGFGFICRNNGGTDIYAHSSQVAGTGYKTLDEGQRVEFSVSNGPKGVFATNVVPISE
jgi:cold shock protein